MFNLMKTFALCVCVCCVADTMQHGVLFLFGEGINWATYFDVSKPLGGVPKKLEIQLAVLNSSKAIDPIKDSEIRLDFQRISTETVPGKLSHILYPARNCILCIVQSFHSQTLGFLFQILLYLITWSNLPINNTLDSYFLLHGLRLQTLLNQRHIVLGH